MKRPVRPSTAVAMFGLCLLLVGQEDCLEDSPPKPSANSLALDCVIKGNDVFIPLEPVAVLDRPFFTPGTGAVVDTSLTARLPADLFCALSDAGYTQVDLGSATVALSIAAVTKPVPPEVALSAIGLPIPLIDTALACGGSLGAEIPLDFPVVTSIPWSDGGYTVDLLLTVGGIDVALTNLAPSGPDLSLIDLCEPADRSVPANGTTDDPEDSPRIAADKNGDGSYEAAATAQEQIQLPVNGWCAGYKCDDFNDCTVDTCLAQAQWCIWDNEPDGTSCGAGSGTCQSGVCAIGPSSCGDGVVDPGEECDDGNLVDGDGCGADCVLDTIVKTVPVACNNNITLDVFEHTHEITIDPLGPIVPNAPFSAEIGGQAMIPEFWLNALQGVIPGGIRNIEVETLQATATVRSGANGPGVLLSVDESYTIAWCFSLGGVDTGESCEFACLGECKDVFPIPTLDGVADNCAACNAMGTAHATQCSTNGFCSDGDAYLPLKPEVGTFTADAFGSVFVGWQEGAFAGTPSYGDPAGPNGMRWGQSGVSIAIECFMGHPATPVGPITPLDDTELVELPIITASVCPDGIVQPGEECDDGNTTPGDGCAADCTVEPISRVLPLACLDNAIPGIRENSYVLDVDPLGPVLPNTSVDFAFSGQGEVPEFWLDALHSVIPGGATEIGIGALQASVAARSGATGPDVLLTIDDGAAISKVCGGVSVDAGSPCTSDFHCINTCLAVFSIPVLDGTGDACAACNAINSTKATQCLNSGFCVVGSLTVPLTTATGTFTTDSSGDVLFGWNESVPLPPLPLYSDPAGPNGNRWESVPSGLFVAAECTMGTFNVVVGTVDALADVDLISLPILPGP